MQIFLLKLVHFIFTICQDWFESLQSWKVRGSKCSIRPLGLNLIYISNQEQKVISKLVGVESYMSCAGMFVPALQ